ncbi:MAG TPA: Ig-like domain-containing protein, partial [Planctomycetaceae bacterium]
MPARFRFSRPAPAPSRRAGRPVGRAAAEVLEDRVLLAAPVAKNDAVSTDADTVLNGDLFADNGSGADSDPDGDPFGVTAVNGNAAAVGQQITLASGALLTVNANGTFTYDPNGRFDALAVGETANEQFTYTITDSQLATSTASVTITISGTNQPPTAGPDSTTTVEDQDVIGALLGNDGDPDGDALVVSAVNGDPAKVGVTFTLPSGASLTVASNGTYLYDPGTAFRRLEPGEKATDSFTYTVSDGHGGTATATVTITIVGVGADDLTGFYAGEWWVGRSSGTKFNTTRWGAGWHASFDALRQGDFNGDGRGDVLGLFNGAWHVGLSTGTAFTRSVWGAWGDL